MIKNLSYWLLLPCLFAVNQSTAMMQDDPWVAHFAVDELEYRKGGSGELKVWDMQLSLGQDLQQWTLAWQGEADEDEIEDSELSLDYSRAISPYWNASLGFSHVFQPRPERSWLSLGVEGLAAYFVDVDLQVLLNEEGDMGFSAEFEKELMLTQRWHIDTGLAFSAYAQNDRRLDIDAGVHGVELAVRLGYAVTRKFSPYVGVVYEWQNSHFQSSHDETWAVAGLSFWF